MNKLRPGIIPKVGYKEDGSRNIRNFRIATARYGVDPNEMFEDEDLFENTPEGMGNVANSLLYLAQLIEDERQSLVLVHDGGKSKSTLYVSASRIVSKTEPVKFDEKPSGTAQSNGGRSPYGTLSRHMGVMSNPELASKARAISPVPSAAGRDKSPPPKISSPVPLGHRPSQHRQNGPAVRPSRVPSGSPMSPGPSSPRHPPPVTRTSSHSPRMPRIELRRTSSPLLEKRLELRQSSTGARPSFGEPCLSPPPPLIRPSDRLGVNSVANPRQSATSIVTNSSLMTESTAAFSSLLESHSNGFGTMRTTTTEATSPSSGAPSFSRSEANEAAKAVLLAESPKVTRRRLSDIGNPLTDRSSPLPQSPTPEDVVPGSPPSSGIRASKRDRRASEAAADLTRVNEEPDEPSITPSKLLARRRSKILDNDPSKRVARKWPDDFDSSIDAETKIEQLKRELMPGGNSSNPSLELKTPPALAPIVVPSHKAKIPPPLLSDEPRPSRPILVPRRAKRYSADSGILHSPREGSALGDSRDASPTSGPEILSVGLGRPPVLRQSNSRSGKRVYVPKGSTPPSSEGFVFIQRSSPAGAGPSPLSSGQVLSQHVPFPRRASAEFAAGPSRLPALPSSSETLRHDPEGKDGQPAQPTAAPQRANYSRGRHQSEFDSQRKKAHPGSVGEAGVRRQRMESMFEGVRREERLAQHARGQISHRVLVVKEEGQPAVNYVGQGFLSSLIDADSVPGSLWGIALARANSVLSTGR